MKNEVEVRQQIEKTKSEIATLNQHPTTINNLWVSKKQQHLLALKWVVGELLILY